MTNVNESCLRDVHQLRIFLEVADKLSFTRAAERLYLTQSAVSHQIARLERGFGAPLLRREGRGVSLTAQGQVLAQQARKIIAAVDEAELAVRQAARPDLGRLRVGASAAACQFLIPEALREFRECFPGYAISILPGDSADVADALIDGSIDLGILIRAETSAKLLYHDLFTDELGFVVSPLHPWAKGDKIDRRELSAQHYVLYTRNSATFRMVERYFVRMQSPLRNWIELGSPEAIKELVKLGLGVSVMARWIASPELAAQSLVWLPMPGPKLKRRWCIAALSGRGLSNAEQTFLGLCRSAGAQLPVS